MNSYRVSGRGRVDASSSVSFTFDGKTYRGLNGDTSLRASCQWRASDGPLVQIPPPARSGGGGFRGAECADRTRRGAGRSSPNTRATVQEIWNGLETTSQNKYPSLKFDIGAVNDMAYMLFSAGFYYKTFMWPKSFWNKVYEPFIRAAAV